LGFHTLPDFRPLSHTLRGFRRVDPASAGSRATFRVPQNSFVWEKLKVDSRPHNGRARLHHGPRAARTRTRLSRLPWTTSPTLELPYTYPVPGRINGRPPAGAPRAQRHLPKRAYPTARPRSYPIRRSGMARTPSIQINRQTYTPLDREGTFPPSACSISVKTGEGLARYQRRQPAKGTRDLIALKAGTSTRGRGY